MLRFLAGGLVAVGIVGGALYAYQTRIDTKLEEAREIHRPKVAVSTEPRHEESISRSIGRAAGQFGAGVSESITDPMHLEWITIAPRSREECIAASNGVLDRMYMRCRNGRQEQVRYDSRGKKIVIRERPIPSH